MHLQKHSVKKHLLIGIALASEWALAFAFAKRFARAFANANRWQSDDLRYRLRRLERGHEATTTDDYGQAGTSVLYHSQYSSMTDD